MAFRCWSRFMACFRTRFALLLLSRWLNRGSFRWFIPSNFTLIEAALRVFSVFKILLLLVKGAFFCVCQPKDRGNVCLHIAWPVDTFFMIVFWTHATNATLTNSTAVGVCDLGKSASKANGRLMINRYAALFWRAVFCGCFRCLFHSKCTV